jgi:hypothetical protein
MSRDRCPAAPARSAGAAAELRFMRWGVGRARRGWAASSDVANARSLSELLPFVHQARR